MSEFIRGIHKPGFISHLNRLREINNSYWNKMILDKDLFIAIRNESINVYYKGQSLCKLEYKTKGGESYISARIHKKYLGILENKYINLKNGIVNNVASRIGNLNEIDAIKRNIEIYTGKEKIQSYSEVITNNNLVIDVEVTLIKEKEVKVLNKSKHDRSSIDYVTIDRNGTLVFFEAKHFENQEIRSEDLPKVIKQIRRYEEDLLIHRNEIKESYFKSLNNIISLGLNSNITTDFIPKKAKDIKIDYKPKLIVFGSNNRPWTGKDVLREYFGDDRLIIHN